MLIVFERTLLCYVLLLFKIALFYFNIFIHSFILHTAFILWRVAGMLEPIVLIYLKFYELNFVSIVTPVFSVA